MPLGDMPIPNGGDGDSIGKGCVLWLDSRYFTESFWWDISKYRNNGVVHGAKWKTNAFYFDGIDDYIDCGNHESLNIGNKFTIAGWVKQMSGNTDIIVGRLNSAWQYAPNGAFIINYNSFTAKIGGSTKNFLFYSAFNDGKWHFFGVTYNKTKLITYIDSDNLTYNETGDFDNAGNLKVMLGRRELASSPAWFNGYIGMIYFLKGVDLSLEEIKILYNLTYRR